MRYSTPDAPASRQAFGLFRSTFVCALVLFLAIATAALAQIPNKPLPSSTNSVLLSEGVVIDLERSALYLMSPAGKTEAVDLITGSTLWTSAASSMPLLLVDGRLLVQGEPAAAGELALQLLDRQSGDLAGSYSAGLPAGVWATIEDGPRHSFRVWARGGAAVSLGWMSTQTSERPLQGYLPQPEKGLAPSQNAELDKSASFERLEGSLVLDLASGAVSEPVADAKSAVPPSRLSEGRFLASKDDGRQFLSADGRHVLVSELVSMREGYRWTLYTRHGELLGEIGHRFSTAPFIVAGQTLILRSQPHAWMSDGELVDRPLALHAIDLSDGAELFAKALGSVEFAGPFPP